jgi:hypothetical protein
MSFGFYVVKDDWETETVETSDGQSADVEVRIIREVKLLEVSAVTFPAYEGTDAGLRSLVIPALRSRGDVDAIARRAGFRPELADLLNEVDPNRPTIIPVIGRSEVAKPVEVVEVPTAAPVAEVVEPSDDSFTDLPPDVAPPAPADGAVAETEPGESTRADDASTTDDTATSEVAEPAETTRTNRPVAVNERMNALATRFGIKAAA